MSMAFFGWITPYTNRDNQYADVNAADVNDTAETAVVAEPESRSSLLADAFSFQRHRNERVLRPLAIFTLLTTAWLLFPRTVFAKKTEYTPISQLAAKGLTQTPDAKLRARINARESAEKAKRVQPRADVEPLTSAEMKAMRGRGPKRNKYFTGTLPWQRSLRDVNLCNGNLFKSFTDVQVAPGRGAGLALQRTYNSNDDRSGPFGTGWTHAYDIRMEEAGTVTENNVEKEVVPRTDFFGGKHKYSRDADGLYTPPAYLYDEMDSRYDQEMISGLPRSQEDTEKGMDGTVKHFVPEGTDANGKLSTTRVCDYIEDRFGNRTNLTYGLTATFPDGSTKKLLTQVKDPVNRALNFTWTNLGSGSAPAWRITSVQSPLYTVTYEYYQNASDTSSYLNLWKVRLDSAGLNRTTTYTYTTCDGETGLLASIADPLGNTVSYRYVTNTPTGTIWIDRISEPPGVDENGVARSTPLYWYILPGYSGGGILTRFSNRGINTTYLVTPYVQCDSSLRVTDSGANNVGAGNMTVVYDVNNNVTQQKVRDGDWAISQTNTGAYETTVNKTYGPFGNVLQQKVTGYENELVTYTYYNASKYFQKATVTDALGRVTSFDYFDNADAFVGNRGNVAWVRDAGYSVSTSPSYNKQFTYTYNANGQKASETNLNGVVTNYTYDASYGNLTQVVQDAGTGKLNRTTSMVYDTVGRVTNSTDPNGQTSTFTYNTLGQPLSASFPAKTGIAPAETISYSYGTNGRTTSVTDNRGTTTMAYEPGCDRVSSVTDPVTGTIGYRYTVDGQRSRLNLPGGGTVSYEYYNDSVVNFDPESGLGDYIATYPLMPSDDPNSLTFRLKRITDDQGRIVDIIQGENGSISVADAGWMGNVYGSRSNQTFDSGGNLLSYVESLDSYDRVPLSGGTLLTQTQKRLKTRRVSYFYKVGGSWTSKLLNQNAYTYNTVGQRLTNTITTTNTSNVQVSRTETYTYDELSRLKTANYGDGETQGYTFDAMGNRLAKTDNITGNEGYTFDNANRIATRQVGSSAVQSYTSDANGNTLTDGTRTNLWDSQNRLVSCAVSGTGAKTSTFAYGSDGLRRKFTVTNSGQTVPASITHFGYDGTNVVREWSEDPSTNIKSIAATYLLGPSGPMYKRPANAADVRWYVYDGLGSVVGEVDVNGLLTCQKTNDAYGISRGIVGTAKSRHGYVGGLGHYSDDETGLAYMRARYYDPAIGRFISEDPGLHGLNWFVYCHDDPINFFDSTGKEELGSVLVGSTGSISLDGVGLSASTTGMTCSVTGEMLEVNVGFMEQAAEGSFNKDAFLAAFREYAVQNNLKIIQISTSGLTIAGMKTFYNLVDMIRAMDDWGILMPRGKSDTVLYWLVQNG